MSSTNIVDNTDNNLFDDVSGAESAAGDTEYRGIYIQNDHGSLTLQDARIYVSVQSTSPDTDIDVALAAEAVNTTMATIANESTAPTSVTFTDAAVSYATGLQLNGATGLPAGQRKGVWVKRVVNAAAAAAVDTATLKVEGDTAA